MSKQTFFFYLSLIWLCATLFLNASEITLSGRLLSAESGKPVALANILLVGTDQGTISSEDGSFAIGVPELPITLKIRHIAFRDTLIQADRSELGIIRLQPAILIGEEVMVSAARAVPGKAPVAFSTMTAEEIEMRYSVEDVPMMLAAEPGVYAYSESGNGTGYSYISIRGFDQSRIAVMLDNVPLNDNESHQVYWVDHGDILSDAEDVQIQRGIGNSLYGSSAFGGSVNVLTRIWSKEPEAEVVAGGGSYGTSKLQMRLRSGSKLSPHFQFTGRVSQIQSDGYREHHGSLQRAIYLGAEQRHGKLVNQLRALIGYENTHLTWDGIHADQIGDREQRRAGYKAYTDDFLQQIYSLNTQYRFSQTLLLRSTAYLVSGSGYYEVFKEGRDFYSYNLDILDLYTDDQELETYSDLLRQKWIVNSYYGLIPVVSWDHGLWKIDLGGEFRFYRGDHFGRVKDFSEPNLSALFEKNWYEYYNYVGNKRLLTGFVHCVFVPHERLRLVGDLQYQGLHWELDQEQIGHSAGHQLSANWDFVNPRIGMIYSLSERLFAYVNYGSAQKEPADAQIINADDVWSSPLMAAAEAIDDYEIGAAFRGSLLQADLNLYRIRLRNEQLKNIDVEQEGEYDYYAADATLHQGLEFDLRVPLSTRLILGANATLSEHTFRSGSNRENKIPNVPGLMGNLNLSWRPVELIQVFLYGRFVGEQFLDAENNGHIDPYFLMDLGARAEYRNLTLAVKLNNVLDTLYSTYGYGYEWDGYQAYYWPGATRNFFASLSYTLR